MTPVTLYVHEIFLLFLFVSGSATLSGFAVGYSYCYGKRSGLMVPTGTTDVDSPHPTGDVEWGELSLEEQVGMGGTPVWGRGGDLLFVIEPRQRID